MGLPLVYFVYLIIIRSMLIVCTFILPIFRFFHNLWLCLAMADAGLPALLPSPDKRSASVLALPPDLICPASHQAVLDVTGGTDTVLRCLVYNGLVPLFLLFILEVCYG